MWAGEPPETERLWGEHIGLDQIAAAERGYDGCGPAEQLLWERLSVFEGAFGREAVREVCASGTLPAGEIQTVLDRLAPLALLPVDDLFDGEDGLPRYWMPHPMRAVGARRLTARGDRWAVLLHHRRWCAKVARRTSDWWQRGRQLDARDLALRELPDLAAAMDPTTAPLSPNAEAETSVEIAVSLWFLWVACGRIAEGRSRLRHALSLHAGPPPARALWLAAFLELESGRPEDADPLLAQAWAAAVRDGDERCLSLLAHLRGATALYQGRTRAAAAEFREALALMEEHPEFGPSRQACWVGLALSLCRSDPEAAQEALDQGDLDRESQWAWVGRDVFAEAWAYHVRAELGAWDGDRKRAAEYARRALREHLRLGSAVGAACAAELLAQMRAMDGQRTAAAHLLGAVDLLRTSVFDASYRPAEYCAVTRTRGEEALGAPLGDPDLRKAYEEGARRGLFALSGEI
ncbi:tetratricopeptide repeat protein [Streptomyces sp. NK15101]|uniref:tetratricopeptide repeat protein n=1 Tax=Streptomyces sp. NK15101 TaxID=2873261 RepID=UPI001CEDE09F|nr:tetratricopeptide repeat protein [Streptomyces sp. NK15101]